MRATASEPADGIADFVFAQRTRQRVVAICEELLRSRPTGDDERYWIFATLAEAATALGQEDKAEYALKDAALVPRAEWMVRTTQEQLKRVRELVLENPLRRFGIRPPDYAST